MIPASIHVNSLIGKTLDSRDEAAKLIESISNTYSNCIEVSLDFEDVEFMSRSFADEFHKQKMNLVNEKGYTILVTNASHQIIDILKAVSKTQTKRSLTQKNIPIYSFSDDSAKDLRNFMLSL
jgi:hypothetical protein